MTEQLPRAIAAKDILPGMEVEARSTSQGVVKTFTFTADYTHDGKIYAKDSGPHGASFAIALFDWFLISRPTPPREPGALWRDPETSGLYVRTANDDYSWVDGDTGMRYLNDDVVSCREIIARLLPVEPPEVAEMRRTLADAFSKRAGYTNDDVTNPDYRTGYVCGLRDAAEMTLRATP